MAKAALLILNYNGKHHLEEYLPGILDTANGYPVIIGDNASTDDSVNFLKLNYPAIRLVEFSSNLGYAEGYNQLIAQCEFEYLVILNSDVSTTTGWLTPLIDFLERNPDVAAVQPKIKSISNKSYFEYAGAAGGFIDQLGYPFCRGRIFDHLEQDQGQYNDEAEVFWVSGACFVIRSTAFYEAGGFDKDFFAHMEEIDLCWRLQRINYKLFCLPSSTVFHLGGGTLNYGSPFKTYLNYRNGINMLIKNLPKTNLYTKLPVRLFMDWLSFFRFFIKGQFSQAFAIVKAHWAVIKNLESTFIKRRTFTKNNAQSERIKLPNISVVWGYFVKSKKTYNELIPD